MNVLLVALLVGGLLVQVEPQPPSARALLNEALDALATRPLGRERVDWPALRAKLLREVPESDDPMAAYAAIRQAVAALGDPHARFEPRQPVEAQPAEVTKEASNASSSNNTEAAPRRVVPTSPEGRMLEGQVAYVVVPICGAPEVVGLRQYATALRQVVLDLERETPRGWIIELRFNGGGNVWPMLLGLRPILGDGHLAGSIEGGAVTRVGCDNTQAWLSRGDGPPETQLTIDVPPGDQLAVQRPVAVLIGPWTMSSGEMLTIALAGHPQARLFGEPTAGLTTATDYFPLSDGSRLNLPVSRMADRSGRAVAEKIAPQVEVEINDWPAPDDKAAEAARQWVLEHQGDR